MERRAAIPPDLPCCQPTVSCWQEPSSVLADFQSTPNLPSHTDVIIVGSGITGASIAYHLLHQDPALSVLMLEARTACSGATGRNGGHTKAASYREFLDDCMSIGEDEAAKVVRLQYDCVKEIHAFVRKHSINCDSWEGDTLNVFYSQAQLQKTKRVVAAIRQVLGNDDPAAQYTFYNPEETARKFFVQGSLGSVCYAAGSINAYEFVIGLLKLALSNGLNLHTQTPVVNVSHATENGGECEVVTARGSITAKRVILATNGYTARLLPQMQGVLVPLRGTITAQRPGQVLSLDRLSTTYSFIGETGYEYMISRPQHSKFPCDIIIGGGLPSGPEGGLYEYGTTDDSSVDARIADYLSRSTETYFGSSWGHDHPEGRVRKTWTGIMGYAADGFPYIGQVPGSNGLYVAASFQGSGMVLAFKCSQALVAMVVGKDDEQLNAWFPRAFRTCWKRLEQKFRGRLHATVNIEPD